MNINKIEFNNEPNVQEVKGRERIEDGVWRPGSLEEYSSEVAVAASTKILKRDDDPALRILGDAARFDRPFKEKFRAGRILAQLRNKADSSVNLHHFVKSQLANSGNVKKIDEAFVADLKKGNLDDKKNILKTDGLITDLKGYPLYVSAADCYPVAIYDPDNKAIGLFHNGTYGLTNRILENTLTAMTKEYGTDMSKVKAVIGPGISNDYVVTKKTLSDYQNKFPEFDLDKYTEPAENPLEVKFDLAMAIRDGLIRQGVSEANIESSRYSTDKNNDLFPSSRVEGGKSRDNYGFMIVLK